MKVKTSVTLSEEILKAVKRASGRTESRSQAVERLLRDGLATRARRLADASDLASINAHADALNAEADDVLAYQGEV